MNIGLIAGGGQFPILFSKAAEEKGYKVFAVAFKHESDPELGNFIHKIEWQHLGQIKRLIKFFKKNDVSEVVMLGAITKTKMFRDFKPDTKAISILTRLKSTHDDSFLRLFARILEDDNIHVKASTFLLPEMLAEEGCWTKRKPNKVEKKDIEAGWKIAKEVGDLDIGQCVIISSGTILAVEAIDGTDATIKRGGELGKGQAVVVKVSKPNQDLRFDVPAVGAQTIKTMHESGANLLVLEAGKAVTFDKKEMVVLADKHKISIVVLKDGIV